jgi:hypothetical protein
MVEVFANGRQALCQQVFPTREDSVGVQFIATGGTAEIKSLRSWKMAATTTFHPTYPMRTEPPNQLGISKP